jgi:hypothetical protein
MRRWMLAGLLLLGTGAVAHEQGGDEPPTAASAGAGGAAGVDTGEWVHTISGRQTAHAQHKLYGQVARELGLEEHPRPARASSSWEGQAVGGGAMAGGEHRGCAETLAANERAILVSGTLSFASGDVLTLIVPGQGPMKLSADASTCAVQAGREQSIESLSEGTEVRAAYVLEGGAPTARVVRAEPQRSLR